MTLDELLRNAMIPLGSQSQRRFQIMYKEEVVSWLSLILKIGRKMTQDENKRRMIVLETDSQADVRSARLIRHIELRIRPLELRYLYVVASRGYLVGRVETNPTKAQIE
ncbi:uncharacterized protein EKO05_0002775 [Ascochyta rabiei]|uniref:uncharacterized protein n=1 Tax=Didymella rabiei TaxID=5454 RepID=UPI00220AD5FC|nr:uncharacterized protein EKO05_0002775 [Ascochyta rabiei]UPX12213.1 hypothetical protein EKO05_0002775 [Ascochyta rabiei]